MAGPSWIAGAFAAVMILTAGFSASRLAVSRLRGTAADADADGMHAVMGAAMAGMLVPPLNVLPGTAWMVVFGTGAAWFGVCAVRARSPRRFSWQCRFPVPHLIECVAMLFMLLSVRAAQPATGEAMPGMGASAAFPALPVVAVVLALFMLGYLMWATDQLASLARARATAPDQARATRPRALVTVAAGGASGSMAIGSADPPDATGMPRPGRTSLQTLLAPELATMGKIVMTVTMGYMLILML